MKFLYQVVVAVSLVTFFTGSAYALSEQDLIQSSGGLGSYGGMSSPGLSSGGLSSSGATGGALDSGTTGLGLEQGSSISGTSQSDSNIYKMLQQRMKEEETGIPEEEGQTKSILEQTGKGKIFLSAEPGDGLVTLNWQLSGAKQSPGELPLKFAVFVGIESGQFTRKIVVGTTDHFRLRGLRNNQLYYVRVMGYREDTSILSQEVKVTPLPQEQLSSELEQSFAKKTVTMQDKIEKDPLKRELKQFGYDFFKNSAATLQATENTPVGNDYVVGPGDSLQIDIWGSIQARYQVSVDRNGEITIPKVGVVKVWGLNYGQAKDAINVAIGRYFKGYNLNVTLGKLRTIQVFVVGEVENPGVYSVSSLATVINALSAAGGPSKNGSLRDVRLLKGGKVTESIDLYDIFLSGDRSKDVRLENGDTIFVPVIGRVAAVAGEVKRPGIYELKDGVTLPQLLEMAGGITAAGNTGRIQVERFEGNSSRVILDYQLKEGRAEKSLDETPIQDRDMVKVFPVNQVMRQVVKLTGNVTSPGEYQFKPGMRVTDLIHGFSYLLPDSYTEAAEITRLVPPDRHKEVLTFNLAKALQGDEKENILLQEQDTVNVFSRWAMQEKPVVSITGQVVNPGTYDYYPHMTIRDLIAAAGSLKRNAFMGSAELTRVVTENGKARSERVNVNLAKTLAGEPGQNLELKPDDAFIVRGVEDWLEASDRFVVLKGEVKFPGSYSISKGEKLSSVIARAGGFTDRAYLKGAKFTRKSVQELQQKRMNEVLEKAELDIMQKQGELASVAASKEELDATKASLDGMLRTVQKLKEKKAEGRVVIRLSSLDELRGSPYDLELMGGDSLEIPQTSKVVNVLGNVYNSTSFVYMQDKDINYYLKKAGGATRDAEEDDIFLVKADGTVVSKQQSSFGIHWDDDARKWTFGSFMSTHPDPGDTLVVPQKLERIAWMREIKDITTILSQVALTAGVVVAAGL
jgi:protein involved in polysaccharide export with SLBB domain